MNGSWIKSLTSQLRDKRFRSSYVAEDIRTGIAFQIRALREARHWSQAELGRQSEKPQSVIARLEDPNYGRFSLQTLLDMAAAFDVALLVRFVSFSELIGRNQDLSPEALAVPDYTHYTGFERAAATPTESAVSADVIPIRRPAETTETAPVTSLPPDASARTGSAGLLFPPTRHAQKSV